MRHKRAKTYKRAISIYTTAFGFRQPFQVLVSNDILLALNRESDIWKQLGACCQGEVKPMITQCCVEALYTLGKDAQAVTDIAKQFERRRCNHRTAIAPDECLKDVIGETNKHRYVLAAQSVKLRTALVNVPGLPIIHFNPRQVLVLSPPSRATLRFKDAEEEKRRVEGAGVLVGVEDGENVVGASGTTPAVQVQQVKRAKPKGPNPLSVKKKAKGDAGTAVKPNANGTRREKKLAKAVEAGKVEVVKQRQEAGGAGAGGGEKRKKTRKRGKGLVQTVREEMAQEAAAAAAAKGVAEASTGTEVRDSV